MRNEIAVQSDMLTWAINRAGYDVQLFTEKNPKVLKWLNGEKKPTVKQLEEFSKKVYLPFGYLLLDKPPRENLPFTFFRTGKKPAIRVNINVHDTIRLIQQRQDWLREYLTEHDFEPLPFVGRFRDSNDVKLIVADIKETLSLDNDWARRFGSWEDAQNHLVAQIEDKGIITVFNGIVENNGHRKIDIADCRGFVLVDKMAPFMFVNNSDYKAAQMFTIAHELAHIWTGHSAGFDFRELQVARDPVERLCDEVAAEFLVPEERFKKVWNGDLKKASKYFKVSEIVIARRALDIGKLTRAEFGAFYKAHAAREKVKKDDNQSGGDFYATAKKRVSLTFATHVFNAVKSGELLYRDAYKLTGLRGDTFQNFFEKYL